ncbi:MAG: AAA family ATPase [Candidatus Hydrogenedens sp.]|nr:AAA family ATPase [Candidatus Hydrogenedens sp.]
MILLAGSVKGGTGKTVTSANLGVERARAGKQVLLVDADADQGNLNDWAALRSEAGIEPALTRVMLKGRDTAQQLLRLRDKFDDIIIDCGGFDSQELRQALVVADLWLIPMKPSQFQIWTLDKLLELRELALGFRTTPLQGCLLAARASTHPAHDDRATLDAVLRQRGLDGFRVLNAVIHERAAYTMAEGQGMGVSELPRSDRGVRSAVAEIQSLHQEIFEDARETAAALVEA